MKFHEIREVFQKELNFLKMITEYESDLKPLHDMRAASMQIVEWHNDGYDEFPQTFLTTGGPSLLMALWNTFITPDKETADAIQAEEFEELYKKEHPETLAFDGYYPDGSCLFIDPESIAYILQQHNYDEAHCDLIAKALAAYHQNYIDNL